MTTKNPRTLISIASLALAATFPSPRDGTDDDSQPGFDALVSKHGDTIEGMRDLARRLYGENTQERGRKRTAKAEADELRKKIPAEGTVVLTKEQAAEWTAYLALGKPADLQGRLEAGEKATQAAKAAEAETHLGKMAGMAGYNVDAFKKLALADGIKLEEGSETVDGKPKPVVFVVLADNSRTKVQDYAAKNWGAFLPSLTAPSQQGNNGNGTGGTGGGAGNGTGGAGGGAGAGGVFWPRQQGGEGDKGGPTDPASRAQAKRDAGTNPLATPAKAS